MEPKYQISEDVRNKIGGIFMHHSPKDTQTERYELIRAKCKELVFTVLENTPYSREQSLFITQMQIAMMFANASIAINE
jgi:hypothetical protein